MEKKKKKKSNVSGAGSAKQALCRWQSTGGTTTNHAGERGRRERKERSDILTTYRPVVGSEFFRDSLGPSAAPLDSCDALPAVERSLLVARGLPAAPWDEAVVERPPSCETVDFVLLCSLGLLDSSLRVLVEPCTAPDGADTGGLASLGVGAAEVAADGAGAGAFSPLAILAWPPPPPPPPLSPATDAFSLEVSILDEVLNNLVTTEQ